MPTIHVCALSRVDETAHAIGAGCLLSLLTQGTRVERPSSIAPEQHQLVGMSDIVVPTQGHVVPALSHVEEILAFVRQWDRQSPMLIHCYAGVSRSTAAAFIVACALDPACDELALAREIRLLSPTATPNARLVELADGALARNGRMVAAIAAIGRGADCFEGVPFALQLAAPP